MEGEESTVRVWRDIRLVLLLGLLVEELRLPSFVNEPDQIDDDDENEHTDDHEIPSKEF